jgi:hypothetical protein
MENDLVLAVIQKAVEDLMCFRPEPGVEERRANAKRWLESESIGFKSFRWYCELIDLAPDWALRKIRERGVPVKFRSRQRMSKKEVTSQW